MNKDKIYILEDRGLLYISGSDAKEFLQNLITNDIENVSETQSCFASLLSPQGKYLFDFIIVKHKQGYFLDCEKKQIDSLFRQLSMLNCLNNESICFFSQSKKYPCLCLTIMKSNKYLPCGDSNEAKQL